MHQESHMLQEMKCDSDIQFLAVLNEVYRVTGFLTLTTNLTKIVLQLYWEEDNRSTGRKESNLYLQSQKVCILYHWGWEEKQRFFCYKSESNLIKGVKITSKCHF